MYKYYCKDSNCPGHTKSWERCCDVRAFSAGRTTKTSPFQTKSSRSASGSMFSFPAKQVLA